MGFYKDIEFLNIQDNVELIKNLNIRHYPVNFIYPKIRKIKLEELYLDEIYFDPLIVQFYTDYICIRPFQVIINGEIFNIDEYKSFLNIKDMLYLTMDGIKKASLLNKDEVNNLLKYQFSNEKIYWIGSRDNINQYSILEC